MISGRQTLALVLTLIFSLPLPALSQKHTGKMDTDGILSPGEIPNPRFNYGAPPYNSGSPYGGYNQYNDRYPDYRPYPTSPGRGECDGRKGYYGPPPHIEIYEVKPTGNVFGGQVKVRGVVEGICISEAGLFEMGRPITRIPTNLDRRFQRFQFEVKTKLADRPEIRVYSTSGARDIAGIR
jgi:hypothetical protein